jgi:hypothetical protein
MSSIPADAIVGDWIACNNGIGLRKWFVTRTITWESEGVARSRPEVLSNARGMYCRFISFQTANIVAGRENQKKTVAVAKATGGAP